LDSTLTLAAAAAVTHTIAIGSAVFLPSLRPLAWTSRQVATLAHLAAGRLELGVGAGAGPEQEYLAAGQLRGDRGRRTDEFLQALPHLLPGGPMTVGSGDDTATIRLRPAVPMPTVWIGGSSPAALRRTVRFGDGWLGALLSPVEFGRARDRLRELADAAGRPVPRLGLVTHAAIAPSVPDAATTAAPPIPWSCRDQGSLPTRLCSGCAPSGGRERVVTACQLELLALDGRLYLLGAHGDVTAK